MEKSDKGEEDLRQIIALLQVQLNDERKKREKIEEDSQNRLQILQEKLNEERKLRENVEVENIQLTATTLSNSSNGTSILFCLPCIATIYLFMLIYTDTYIF